MFAGLLFDVLKCLRFFPSRAVWTVRRECVPDVNNGKDACRKRNFGFLQPARIAAPVPFFMMTEGDVQSRAQVFDGIQHIIRKLRMLAHDLPFLIVQ